MARWRDARTNPSRRGLASPGLAVAGRAAAGRWVIFLLGLLLLGPACKGGSSSSPVPRVTRIVIAGVGEESEHAADPRVTRLMDAAARGLGRAGVAVQLQPAAAQPADFVLRLQLQVQTSALSEPGAAPGPAGSGVRLRALCAGVLSLKQAPSLAGPDENSGPKAVALELSKFDHLGISEDDLPSQPELPFVFERLTRLVEDSAYTLGAELQLLRADSRELLTRVADKSGDEALRATAIQILGRRRERLAIPVLIGLIRDTGSRRQGALSAESPSLPPGADPAQLKAAVAQAKKVRQKQEILLILRDSAIGALIEIGDRAAVRPLLDSVTFLDSAEMGKVMEAVATLGGDEARSYLRFVAGSHPEPKIRDEASAALKRLERRAGEPASPPAP